MQHRWCLPFAWDADFMGLRSLSQRLRRVPDPPPTNPTLIEKRLSHARRLRGTAAAVVLPPEPGPGGGQGTLRLTAPRNEATKNALLRPRRSATTCRNAGLHGGERVIADKDEAGGSTPPRPTLAMTSGNAGHHVWSSLSGTCAGPRTLTWLPFLVMSQTARTPHCSSSPTADSRSGAGTGSALDGEGLRC